MNKLFLLLTTILCVQLLFSCTSGRPGTTQSSSIDVSTAFKSDTIYKSDNLILVKLSKHTYQHISYLQTNDFGKVACNGMIALNEKQAIVFDTPTNDSATAELIDFIKKDLHAQVKAVIPTHFHADCVGGMKTFKEQNIPTFASNKTKVLLQENKNEFASYIQPFFAESLILALGNKKIIIEFLGEGHTRDNVVGYFPPDQVLFGGCLVKEMNAGKGYFDDANLAAWPVTIKKVIQKFPKARIVIPGHGRAGGTELLDYTEKIFQ